MEDQSPFNCLKIFLFSLALSSLSFVLTSDITHSFISLHSGLAFLLGFYLFRKWKFFLVTWLAWIISYTFFDPGVLGIDGVLLYAYFTLISLAPHYIAGFRIRKHFHMGSLYSKAKNLIQICLIHLGWLVGFLAFGLYTANAVVGDQGLDLAWLLIRTVVVNLSTVFLVVPFLYYFSNLQPFKADEKIIKEAILYVMFAFIIQFIGFLLVPMFHGVIVSLFYVLCFICFGTLSALRLKNGLGVFVLLVWFIVLSKATEAGVFLNRIEGIEYALIVNHAILIPIAFCFFSIMILRDRLALFFSNVQKRNSRQVRVRNNEKERAFKTINENRMLKEKLERRAYVDNATSLPNINKFKRDSKWIANESSSCGLISLCINNYRDNNSDHGRELFSQVILDYSRKILKIISEHSADTTPNCPYVYITDSDTLTVLLPNVMKVDVNNIAKNIKEISRHRVEREGASIYLDISTACSFSAEIYDIDNLFLQVNIAHEVSEISSHEINWFDEEVMKIYQKKLNVNGDILDALSQGKIQHVYQPSYSSDGSIFSLEALTRWYDSEGNLKYAPDDFILTLEESGLIYQLTCKTICDALEAHREWSTVDNDLKISFNLSTKLLNDERFHDFLKNKLIYYGVVPSSVIVEVREEIFTNGTNNLIDRCLDLKSLGVLLAIDQFGSGNTGVFLLARYPLDIVKFDAALLEKLLSDDKHQDSIDAVKKTIRSHGIKAIVTGVQTKSHSDAFVFVGLDYQQGNYLSKPKTQEQITSLLMGSKHC